MMFSLEKVDDSRAREQEEKGTTNPRPIFPTIIRSSDERIEGTILMEQFEVETVETNAQAQRVQKREQKAKIDNLKQNSRY